VPPLYELAILTPDRTVFEGRVGSLVAPGLEGYFGVLARHAPMVAELATGEFALAEEAGERKLFAVSAGYLEVGWDRVTVLLDAAEEAGEIDVERARAAEERAEQRLRSRAPEVDVARAESALRRALNRVRLAEKSRRQR